MNFPPKELSDGPKRHKRITDFQRQQMLKFMNEHPKLQRGKYDSNFTMEDARQLWQKLTSILNSMQGPNKTWLYWRKSWHDMQCLQRKTGKACKDSLPPVDSGLSVPDDEFGDESFMDIGEEKIQYQMIGETSIRKVTPPGSTTASLTKGAKSLNKSLVKNDKSESTMLLDNDDHVEHEYYKKKLELLERQTMAFETQAQAMQMQAEALLELTDTVKHISNIMDEMNKSKEK